MKGVMALAVVVLVDNRAEKRVQRGTASVGRSDMTFGTKRRLYPTPRVGVLNQYQTELTLTDAMSDELGWIDGLSKRSGKNVGEVLLSRARRRDTDKMSG
jgi:hypothetical protein